MRLTLTLSLFLSSLLLQAQSNWQPLFNGHDLKGWKVLGDDASFHVSGDTIIGTNHGRNNTFLATEKVYGDFVLQLDVWADPRMNSGIQFRSAQKPNGRVFGYQAEIDPSERAYSGGIYDEARRDWLYPLSLNPAGQKAFKVGQWNEYRIAARGTTIFVWVNGICTAVLHDSATAEGFIALQVHGVGTPEEEGRQAKWRNVKILTGSNEPEEKYATNGVYALDLLVNRFPNAKNKKQGKLLWNGEDFKGWRQVHGKGIPHDRWQIKGETLQVLPSGTGGSSDGKDLITKKQYQDFELTFEYKLSEGANSGVKYLVNEDLNPEGGAIGLEFQLLDNERHPDAKMGKKGNRTQGSLYDLIPAENLSYAGMGKRYLRPIGQWNYARIIVKGNKVEHWLNGFKIVAYERNTEAFNAMVQGSKYKDWPNFGNEKKGHIVLQDHGNAVSYRSIKIVEF